MIDLDELWAFDDPAASEARFRERLAALPADEPAARLEATTQLARSLGMQRRFAEADSVLDTVEQALAAPGAGERARVRYLLERGRVRNSSGDPAAARPYFVEAFDHAQAAGEDALAVDAAHMVAIVEPPEGQDAWNERALAIAEAADDPRARRWRASLLNNMGWTRHGAKDHAAALALFERALAAREEQGAAGAIRIARWCVARCLRSLGRLDEALAAQESLARELAEAGESDGYVDEERAECLLALGRAAEARPHFARAHELLAQDPFLAANEAARLERLCKLAQAVEQDAR